jgi:superfamily I DNA and RNA helicase
MSRKTWGKIKICAENGGEHTDAYVATLYNRGSIKSLTFSSENTATQSNGEKYRQAIYLQLRQIHDCRPMPCRGGQR